MHEPNFCIRRHVCCPLVSSNTIALILRALTTMLPFLPFPNSFCTTPETTVPNYSPLPIASARRILTLPHIQRLASCAPRRNGTEIKDIPYKYNSRSSTKNHRRSTKSEYQFVTGRLLINRSGGLPRPGPKKGRRPSTTAPHPVKSIRRAYPHTSHAIIIRGRCTYIPFRGTLPS